MRILLHLAVYAALITSFFGQTAFALNSFDLPPELEPEYVQATIAFNSGQFDKTLSKLASLITRTQQNGKAYELQALCLKAQRRDDEAIKTYAYLIKLAGDTSRKFKYYFEAATLLFRAKRFSHARPYFYASQRGGFNVGASDYFLGLMDYEDKQWQPALKHFAAVLRSDARDLKTLAWFYQGLISHKQGDVRVAVGSMREALEASQVTLANQGAVDASEKKAAEEIEEAAMKVLRDFDRSQWDAAVSLVFQYDSNVSLLPETVKLSQQLEGKSTIKEIFTGNVAYRSSPVRDFQWEAGYLLFFNLNNNGDTKNFDFLSHITQVALNYLPMNPLRGGVRLSGNFTFQNLAGREGSLEMFPFSLTGDLGGYVAYDLLPRLNLEISGGYLPKKYHQDPGRGDERRSGDGYEFKLKGEYASPWPLLNPLLYLGTEKDSTNGKSWRYTAFKIGFGNTMYLKPKIGLVTTLDLSFPQYDERTPKRSDTYLAWRVAAVKEIMPHVSLFADFNLIKNNSTLNTLFAYTRYFTGLGAQYAF